MTPASGRSVASSSASLAVCFAALSGIAVALWLVPASVNVVDWTADGPHRLALFPARARLLMLLSAAVAATGLLLPRRRFASPAVRWFLLLWLWTVPFLPWLPDRFPLLLLAAGPLRWIVAAAAVAGAVRETGWTDRFPSLPLESASVGRRFVFAASLAAYLILGSLHARAIGPGGDEPHYLVIAHSLLTDGDLRIENNHVEGDYRRFWSGPPLRPDYMKRGLNGEIYSIHAPGLPALMLPVYAAAGYGGVVALLSLIAALTAVAIFDLTRTIADQRSALVTWAAVCLTVPFVPQAWLIYPELPGALIVAWSAQWVWRQDNAGAGRWALRGAALAVLPWLHTKFVIFLALGGAALAVKLRRQPRLLGSFALPIAASVAAWLISFYVLYGTFNPEAPYGDYPKLFVLVRNIPRGLLGLLFDQKFGLLIYAPVYVFAVAGAWLMLRRTDSRWFGAFLLITVAAHVGSTTRLYMWWGGNSAPARFLLPILPCLAPPIAVAIAERRSAASRALLWTTLVASLIVAIGGVLQPERLLLFSDPRGKGRIVELLQGPAPLSHLLPTFAQEDWRGPLRQLLPWLAAVAVTVAVMLGLRQRRPLGGGALSAGIVACLVFTAAAAVFAANVPREGQLETARRGAIATLWQYDPLRSRAFDYAGLHRVDQNGVLQLTRLTIDVPAGPGNSPQRIIAGPFNLPAGSYEARIRMPEGSSGDEEVVVAASDGAVFARTSNRGQNPMSVRFELPVGVGRLTISGSGAAAAATAVEVAATALRPPDQRERAAIRTIESIPDHPGAYIAYANEHAYPEGGVFWTRGTGAASVLVAVGGARTMILTLFSGPTAADCTVTVAGERQTVKMIANQTSTASFKVPDRRPVVPVVVQASSFFRPSEVDPASTDNRGLGCQIRIGLE